MSQPTFPDDQSGRQRGPRGNHLDMYREGKLFIDMKRKMRDHLSEYDRWLQRYFMNRGEDPRTYVRNSVALAKLVDNHFDGKPEAILHIPMSAIHILSQDRVLSNPDIHYLIRDVYDGKIEPKAHVLRSLLDEYAQEKALPLPFPVVTQQPLVEVEEEAKTSSPDLATILRTVAETLLQAATEIERLSLVS